MLLEHGKVNLRTKEEKMELKQKILQSMAKAKENNCCLKVRYGKVLVCGASAAGKTNFLNLLMGEDFQLTHISTELAKPQQVAIVAMKVQCSKNDNKIMFKKMEIDAEIEQLRKYLPEEYTRPSIQSVGLATDDKQGDAKSEIQQTSTTIEDIMSSDLADADEPSTQPPEEIWDMLTFMDTGGQPQFISLLPAVNSFAMITFIVHNMTGGKQSLIKDKVMVKHGNKDGQDSFERHTHKYTYHELIKTLMSYASSVMLPDKDFLNDYKDVKKINNTSISFIGTHSAGVLLNDIKEIDFVLDQTIGISSAVNIKTKLNMNYDYLAPIDNKEQEKDIIKAGTNHLKYTDPSRIHNYIHELLKKQDVYNVPIQWLLLELEIRKICNERKSCFITYDEVLELSRVKKLGEDNFIKNGLRFHHLFGVLLYFEIKGMPELIITNHQWLFEKLTEIVLYSFENHCGSNKKLKKCRNEGIFEETFLDKLHIGNDFKNCNISTFDPKEYFLKLLQHLGIIAALNKKPAEYFMPSLLKSFDLANPKIPGTKKIIKIDTNNSIDSEPLLIQFRSVDENSSFPRGIFCFLVVELIGSREWKVDVPAYDNLVSFIKLDTLHYITLIDKIFFLEVQVTHRESSYNSINDDIFISIKGAIDAALLDVGSRLTIKINLEYGFNCKFCKETHISLENKENPEYFFCSNTKPTKLGISHKIWFQRFQVCSYLCAILYCVYVCLYVNV